MFDWILNNFWKFYVNLPTRRIRFCIALLQYHVNLSQNLKQSFQVLSENDIRCICLDKKIYSVNVLLEKVTSVKIKKFTKNQNGALVLRVSRAPRALLPYVARKLVSLVPSCLTCFLPCV